MQQTGLTIAATRAVDKTRLMDSCYKYKRLDLATDSIRLIRILKGDIGPIECALFETSLSGVEGIPYEALSYVWGDRESGDRIWVDGCQFRVTENLFEALSNLRQPGEDRLLWIDAICIDQSHHAERGHQVGQMHRIYGSAHNIIIWLGASDPDIDCLFYWMRYLDYQMLTGGFQHTMETWTQQWEFLRWQCKKRIHTSNIEEGLQGLLGREWFSRIWVIQEAALAKAAIVTCGRNTINSRTFVIMPTILDIDCNENVQSRLEIMPGLLRKNSWWSGPESQDLGMLLRKFGKSKAKDPRDIIYALLGLSKNAFESSSLRPNYQISLQEAIQHTVAYLLHQSGDVKSYPSCNDMPSWTMSQFLSALKDLPFQVYAWALRHGGNFKPNPSISWTIVEDNYYEMLTGWGTTYTPWTAIAREQWDHTGTVRKRRDAMIYRLQAFDAKFHISISEVLRERGRHRLDRRIS